MDYIKIAPVSKTLSHTRYLLTLRSEEGIYKSLILFRLSTTAPAPIRQVDDVADSDADEQRGRDDQQQNGNATMIGCSNLNLPIVNREDEDVDRYTRLADQIYVMESACPHLGADMSHADIEECDTGLVAVCPWHRYDFNMRTGKSETGLKACVYKVDIRRCGYDEQHSRAVSSVTGAGTSATENEQKSESESDEELYSIWIEPPDEGKNWRLVEYRPVSEEFADLPPPTSRVAMQFAKGVDVPDLITLKEDIVPKENPPKTLIQWAVLILNTSHPQLKVERTRHAVNLFRTGKLSSIGRGSNAPKPPEMPPREDCMKFVDPSRAAKRKSRAAMLHALANIEQWAWDAIARFGPTHNPPLPHAFFSDFTKIALDESKHFSLLLSRLVSLNTPYGSLPIHSALWESAKETASSLRARLAIVHLVHEARGLDVNPATIAKFERTGDKESVEVLKIIHHDEVTHVTAGHRWFTYVCAQEGECDGGKAAKVDPVQAFRQEVRMHFSGRLKGPFNVEDREKAGLTRDFYEDLAGELGTGVSADASVDRKDSSLSRS